MPIDPGDKKARVNFWYFVAAVRLILLLQQCWQASQQVETIHYSKFPQLLEDSRITEIAVSDTSIRGTRNSPLPGGQRYLHTVRVDRDFAAQLSRYGVAFTGEIKSNLVATSLSWILPALIFVGIWMFFFRRFAHNQGLGGFMQIGKSRAKTAVEKDFNVTSDVVAGVDEAKEELREAVQFLRDPTEYGRLGARIPKGVLLVGPPGTGKTLLARAIAGEAGVPFFSINGSEFVEMFVVVGAARVRDLFEQARKTAPCINFVDDVDALGRARGAIPASSGADEQEQALDQLLAELDGFDPSSGAVLLIATNRPEILDPALLRDGRFDRQILVDRPDRAARIQILEVHIQEIKLGADISIEQIAALTPGFAGADLANLVNEAAVLAARRNGHDVTMDDFNRAIERIFAGLEKKSRLLNPHEREVVAFRETGHALVTIALPGTETVHKASIIPRGIGALGYTVQRPTEDRYLMTRGELENKMAGLLGGRAAEMLVFGELSTGAADDLGKATDIAQSMVMRYGMDADLGQAVYVEQRRLFLGDATIRRDEPRNFSDHTADRIDEAVRTLVENAFARATAILTHTPAILDDMAHRLLAKETLTADEPPAPVNPPAPNAKAAVAAARA